MLPKLATFTLIAIGLIAAAMPAPVSAQAVKEGWANVPGTTVFLRPGIDSYEHSTGLVRDMRTGQKYRPLTLEAYQRLTQTYQTPEYPLAFANPYATPSSYPQPSPSPWFQVEPNAPSYPAPMPAAPSNCPDGNCPLQLPDFGAAPARQLKTGGYACANCNRLTVGDGWQTYWTPEGQPVTFVCKQCWDAMTPQARQYTYAKWASRQQPQTQTNVRNFPR